MGLFLRLENPSIDPTNSNIVLICSKLILTCNYLHIPRHILKRNDRIGENKEIMPIYDACQDELKVLKIIIQLRMSLFGRINPCINPSSPSEIKQQNYKVGDL